MGIVGEGWEVEIYTRPQAVLRLPYSGHNYQADYSATFVFLVHSVFSCFRNLRSFDMDYRIFSVRT